MATNKTPPHKRISRAESGRDSWKMKAIERREQTEKLASALEETKKLLLETQDELRSARAKIVLLENEVFKKKPS